MCDVNSKDLIPLGKDCRYLKMVRLLPAHVWWKEHWNKNIMMRLEKFLN